MPENNLGTLIMKVLVAAVVLMAAAMSMGVVQTAMELHKLVGAPVGR